MNRAQQTTISLLTIIAIIVWGTTLGLLLRLVLPANARYIPPGTTLDASQETVDDSNESSVPAITARPPDSAKIPISPPNRQVQSMMQVSPQHALDSTALETIIIPQPLSIEPREPTLSSSPTAKPVSNAATASAATPSPSIVW